MKKIFTLFAACATSVLVMGQTTHTVQVGPGGSSSFSPSSLTISQGDIVDFVQTSSPVAHNVNGSTSTFPSNPASFNSGSPAGGSWTYSFTFNVAGSYQYHCDPHAPGMSGTITVTAPPPTPEIEFASSAESYDESAGSVNVYLLINPAPAAADSVTLQALPGPGVVLGVDGTMNPTPSLATGLFTLPVPAGADSVFFTVNIIDDSDIEMDEYVDFKILSTGSMNIGAQDSMRFTIEDNDSITPPIPPAYDLNISEVMVRSADSTTLTQDWIEIMNYSGTAYDLGGFSLADGAGSAGVNTLPAYTINPGEAIVVWAGDMADEGAFIANWGLGATPPEIISNDEFTAGAFPTLGDSNDAVVLYDTSLVAVNVCQAAYTTAMPGQSLEFDTACQFTGHAMDGMNGAYTSAGGDVGSPGNATISIREQVLENIRLFPNPTTGMVTLELPFAGTKDIRLMDLRGAVVQTERTGSEQCHLDLSHLPGGIYLIEVSNGQAHNTLRVVVQ